MRTSYGDFIHHVCVIFTAANGDRIACYALCTAPFPIGKAHAIADFTNGELNRYMSALPDEAVGAAWLKDLMTEEERYQRSEESSEGQGSDSGESTLVHIGSQTRQKLEHSGYTLEELVDNPDLDDPEEAKAAEAILKCETTGERELWVKRDDHAGYTIEINGVGYEYVRNLPKLLA